MTGRRGARSDPRRLARGLSRRRAHAHLQLRDGLLRGALRLNDPFIRGPEQHPRAELIPSHKAVPGRDKSAVEVRRTAAARDALVLPARSRDVVLLALHDGGQFSVPVDVGARQLDCVLVELVGPQTRREARYRPLRAVDEGPRGTQRRAERQDKNTTRHLLYLCRSEEEGLRLLVTSSISAGSSASPRGHSAARRLWCAFRGMCGGLPHVRPHTRGARAAVLLFLQDARRQGDRRRAQE